MEQAASPVLPPLPNEEARATFHRARQDGAIISTKHARKRMQEYGKDNNDILSLARSGVVVDPPELDIKTNEWKYKIESQTLQLKAVFTIPEPSKVRLITIITD